MGHQNQLSEAGQVKGQVESFMVKKELSSFLNPCLIKDHSATNAGPQGSEGGINTMLSLSL